jgi:NADH:ubiquinone oxidoreductase subunit K
MYISIRIFLLKWSIYCVDILLVLFFIETLLFFYLFTLMWYHIIILLIILELFILKIYLFRLIFSAKNNITNFFIFLFITIRVAEASIGLSLLTILVRVCGEDNILVINI